MKIEVKCIQKMSETRRRAGSGKHGEYIFKPNYTIN